MLANNIGITIPATSQEIIANLRTTKKYTIDRISQLLGVTPQTINRVINGTHISSKMDLMLIKLYCKINLNVKQQGNSYASFNKKN